MKTKKNKLLKHWQEWSCVLILFTGAILLSLNLPITKWALPILCIGRGWLSIIMYKRKDWPLFYSDILFFIVYIFGIYRWFF